MFDDRLLLLDSAGRKVVWTPMGGKITTIQWGGSRSFTLTDHVTVVPREHKFRAPMVFARPFHRQDFDYYHLIDEIHDWIGEQGWERYVIDYRWLEGGVGWAVGAPTVEQAVAYNLRWCDLD
jgi:hypothetical protein